MIKLTKKSLIAIITILLTTLCLNSILVYAVDNWSMIGHDPQRTGYSTSTILNTNEIKWISNETIAYTSGTPVIADGRLILAAYDKYGYRGGAYVQLSYVYAVNSSTGEHLWSYEITGYQPSSPVIDSGRVYVCAKNYNSGGRLLCLNASTGTLLWTSVQISDYYQPTPLVSNGKIYLGSTLGTGEFQRTYTFYCLNATDGSIIWSIPSDYVGTIPPAIFNDIVFFINYNTLYAVNANTGVQVWNYTASSISSNTMFPIINNGKVFISSDSNIICLDALTGKLVWTSLTATCLTISNDRLLAKYQKQLYCLNVSSGNKLWSFTSATTITMAAVANNRVVFSATNGGYSTSGNGPTLYYGSGELYCLDANSGNLVWYYSAGTLAGSTSRSAAGQFSYPAIADNTLYVYFTDAIYAFGKKDTIPTSLSLSLNSDTSLIGFKVILSGKMQGNVTTTVNQPIKLSYSVTDGLTWNDIAVVSTSTDGTYSAVWQPSATGTYLVKASWNNSFYPYGRAERVEVTRMLSVNSFDGQNVFSVASNSTVSALAFNSTSKELSFTVSGETGTTGFVDVSIAKSLISNIVDVKVYLDNINLNYTATSTATSWLLHFTYNHSTHNIRVDLNSQGPVISEFSSSILTLFMIITLLISMIYFKKHKG